MRGEFRELINRPSYFMTLALMAVRQEVNNFKSSVVVQELEFAMNLALYGLL